MNGSEAKRLKKLVYGDFSSKKTEYTQDHDGSVRCVGRRAAYQRLKTETHTQSGGSKHIYKGKNRPRWLHPKKRGQ
jgi:hypothetical protein